MFLSKKVTKIGLTLILAAFNMSVQGQDLLARQAPIDKKMRAVDSVALHRLIDAENLENPAFALYQDWSNDYAHRSYTNVPEVYKIDLRHFAMPTPSQRVTSNYGYRRSFRRMHYGIDVKVYTGDTIYSAFNGKIRRVAYQRGGYGYYVVIRHPNGLETIYGHLSKQLVKENQTVRAGEPIGLGGNTGLSTGSHLHFELRFMGIAINPAEMFDFVAQDVLGDYYLFRKNGKGLALKADEAAKYQNSMIASIGTTAEKAEAETTKKKATVTSNKNNSHIHKVRSGESLYTIAKKHNTTIEKLCKLNGISRRTILRPGQILRYS